MLSALFGPPFVRRQLTQPTAMAETILTKHTATVVPILIRIDFVERDLFEVVQVHPTSPRKHLAEPGWFAAPSGEPQAPLSILARTARSRRLAEQSPGASLLLQEMRSRCRARHNGEEAQAPHPRTALQ